MMDKTRGTRTTRSGTKRELNEQKEITKNVKKHNNTVQTLKNSPKNSQTENDENIKLNGSSITVLNPTQKPFVRNLMATHETSSVKVGTPVHYRPVTDNLEGASRKVTFVKREQIENTQISGPSESPKKYEDLKKMKLDEEDEWMNRKLASFQDDTNDKRHDVSTDSDEIDLSPNTSNMFHLQDNHSPDSSFLVGNHEYSQTASSESSSKLSSQKTEVIPERLDLTSHGKWNPLSFAKKCFFDMKNGVPLSRAECEEASKALTRNNREVDYYPYLELAQRFHNKDSDMQNVCFGLAFSTMMVPVIDGNGFSLDQAIRNEDHIKLPSGYSFRMSSLITSHQASKWTSSKFQESSKSLLRVAFKKLASHDYYFAAYSPTEYSTSGYYPLGEQFYKSVSKFICCGFKQEFSLELESKCCGMAREVLTYLQDRFRKEYNQHSKMSVSQLTENLSIHLKRVGVNIEYCDIDFNKEPIHQNFTSLKIGS
ncbi:hypothetical protein CAEBREN_04743 [Caenorhabditis brenneri]|uniref:Uncharacterized protein n=1 Tax=Caenorhabditis brenneri TaxID=135651 RepID=G0NZH8_CAEBE|nr:hypothetical protein CAEBREN_04743 [Caenorhabditis brenneri]